MKDFLLILFIFLTIISSTILIYILIYLKIMAKLYYHQHVLAYSYQKNNMQKVIFIGDSHTEFFKTNVYLSNFNILNFGIAGDTTDGVLKRLEKNVIALKPKKVFLQIGINDFAKGKSKEEIYNSIISITEIIKEKLPNTMIYVISLYPINNRIYNFSKFVLYKRNNNKIDFINEQLNAYQKSGKFTYIDMASILKNSFGQLAKQYTIEGLHLNSNAYKLISDCLIPYIIE